MERSRHGYSFESLREYDKILGILFDNGIKHLKTAQKNGAVIQTCGYNQEWMDLNELEFPFTKCKCDSYRISPLCDYAKNFDNIGIGVVAEKPVGYIDKI